MRTLRHVLDTTKAIERDAHSILGRLESSKSRHLTLDASYGELGQLSLKQDELFRQALRCVEHELYRAAHVMAWAGFMDFVHGLLAVDKFRALGAVRSAWGVQSIEDLRLWSDYQVIDGARDCGLYGKTMAKALHGLLNKRNECAHPEDYYPGLNDTLGYIDEVFKRLKALKKQRP